MSWGKTDNPDGVPKWLEADVNNRNQSHDRDNAVFVDLAEAGVRSNREKGLKTPGWNLYHTYQDQNGVTRHKAEPIVVMKVTAADAGDLGVTGNTEIEDLIAADFAAAIDVQPQNIIVPTAGDPAVFTVEVSSNDDRTVFEYQWQTDSSGSWANVSGNNFIGSTTPELTVVDSTGLDGDDFRVIINASSPGDSLVLTSSAASLNFTL